MVKGLDWIDGDENSLNMSNKRTPSKADNPIKKTNSKTTPLVYCTLIVVTKKFKFIATQLSNSACP